MPYSVGGISLKSSASLKPSVGSEAIEPAVTELSSIFIPFALSQPWCEKKTKHQSTLYLSKRKTKPLTYNWFTAELIIHSDCRSPTQEQQEDRTRRTDAYTNSLRKSEGQIMRAVAVFSAC